MIMFAGVLSAIMSSGCSSSLTAEERAANKARQAMLDSVAHNLSVERLDALDFIIPAKTLQIDNGRVNTFPNDVTNFISAHDGKGMIQLASMRGNRLGANGMGGITLEGVISLNRRTSDKKGNHTWEYSLGTTLGMCQILVNLPSGGDRVSVNVRGAFSSGSYTITGQVRPYNRSTISVGRSF